MFSLFILTPILSLVRVEAQQRRGSNHISPPLEEVGGVLYFLVFNIFTHDGEVDSVFQYFSDCRIVITLLFPFHIDVKVIFISFSNDWHRLNLAQIDILLSEALQYVG